MTAGLVLSVPALARCWMCNLRRPYSPPSTPHPAEPPQPEPSTCRAQHGDRVQNLDKVFEALKIALSDESAKFVENRVLGALALLRRRYRRLR